MTTKRLFRLTEGNTVWTFTSSNENETYQSGSATAPEVYANRVVSHSDLVDKAQSTKNTLDVTFPLLDTIGQHFLKSPVDFQAKLEVYTKNEDGTYRTEWRGKLTKTAPSDTKIVLTFNSIFSSNRRVGARPVYQRSCPHTIYDEGCRLVYNDKKVAATVSAISADGLTLTIAVAGTLPQGVLQAGVVEMPDGTMRYITDHRGTAVSIIRVSPSLLDAFAASNPVPVYIARGCNQGTDWCDSVHNNLLNHGGYPFMPLDNPASSAIA